MVILRGWVFLMSEVPLKDNARELLAWVDGGDDGAVPSRIMHLLVRLRKSTFHKIVNLVFTITNRNIKLTVVWGR